MREPLPRGRGSDEVSALTGAAVVLIGFTAATAQIVLLRELMAVFGGNEMAVGLALASWLFWTAVGSALAGRLARRSGDPRRLMAGLEVLLAAALPATILAVRASKTALQSVPGESLGPASVLLVSAAALSFCCLLSGALFPAGARLLGAEPGAATSAAYVLEAIGSVAGGALAGLVLVRFLGALQIACMLGLLNLLAASMLAVRGARVRGAAVCAVAAAFALVWLPFGVPRFEAASLARLWPGYHLAATRNSAYGSLAVVEAEGVRGLYDDGLLLFHAPDPESAEEAVHYALLEHPAPRTLLLIGGGAGGSLVQALQHPTLERVDYVELDPAILDLARDYFPQFRATDSRVHVHVTDGRLFVKETGAAFDVVIVNLPEPRTAQLNRFYTLEFFREAAAKMTPDGVLSFHLAASENYISPDLAEFLRSIDKTLRMVFPEVVAMPGETVHFFAAKRAGVLARDAGTLLARMRERRLATSYVREYYLPFRMPPDRMAALEERIRPLAATRVNRDFEPAAYYFDAVLWSARFSQAYARLLRALASVSFAGLAMGVGLLSLAALAAGRLLPRPEQRARVAAASCTAAMGFTMIGLEVLVLLAFQAIHGSLYRQLALLIGAFMGGMGAGSWLGARLGGAGGPLSYGRGSERRLAYAQACAVLAPAALCLLIPILARAGQITFFGLALLCGMLGGFQFPAASRVFCRAGKQTGLGTLYALDLGGSCLAAVLVSAYLVPVFGIGRTAILAAELNMAPAALAVAAAFGGRALISPSVPQTPPR